MVKRYRDLTEKYRSFRLQSDALYDSRTMQTFFNKFTKKGTKAVARRHLHRALMQLRYSLHRPRLYNVILRMLWGLRMPFILAAKRQGRQILDVPLPIRRNKRDIMSIQTFANAINRRRERNFHERLLGELQDLTIQQTQSSTLKQRSSYMAKVYDERVNMGKRWK